MTASELQTTQTKRTVFHEIKLTLISFSSSYENILLLGDFNFATENLNLKNLLNIFDLKSIIKISACYKSSLFPTYIDLILSNKRTLFMKSIVFETGMSDFRKLTTTILRKKINKGTSKKVSTDTIKLLTRTLLRREFNQDQH